MANWTYESQVDVTNDGTNDQTLIIVTSGLPAGLTSINIFFNGVGTGASNNAPLIRLGDSGGIEDSGYYSVSMNGTANIAEEFDGLYIARDLSCAAGDTLYGVMTLSRLSESEHYWYMDSFAHEPTETTPRVSCGYKTLSAELTQMDLTTSLGTAFFTNGKVRIRYR